jgi:hypothetical protein
VIHRLAARLPDEVVDDVTVSPVDDSFLAGLPDELVPEARHASVAATRSVDGVVVSMCTAGPMTETLWDPGIDTLEPFQRQGHARACFLALARHLRPLTPIWGAAEDSRASLAMAASLGFVPEDELWVLERLDA